MNVTDRQFSALLGISSNMEKSLESIDKNLSSSVPGSKKSTNIIASLAQSITAITAAVSSKLYDAKKANNIIEFSKSLVEISNSANTKDVKAFKEYAIGLSSALNTIIGIMTPGRMLRLSLGSKLLFKGGVLKSIVNGMADAVDKLDAVKLKAGGEALKYLSQGLVSLSAALKSFMTIAVFAPLVYTGALVVRAVVALFTHFGTHAKEIHAGGQALVELGKGLAIFSAGMATLLLLVAIGGPVLPRAVEMIAVITLTFWAIGKISHTIEDGAKALAWAGIGLMSISAGIAVLVLTIISATPVLIAESLMLIGVIALEFYILGQLLSPIKEGVKSLAWIGLGLFAFSIGLAIFMLAVISAGGVTEILKGVAMIATFAALFGFISVIDKGGNIEKGGKSLAWMGLGMASVAVGIFALGMAMKQITIGDAVLAPLLITGLAIAFSIAGAVGTEIKDGAIAMAFVGGALVSLSLGIMLFAVAIQKIKETFKDNLLQAGVIAGSIILGLGLAFAGIGAGPLPGFISAGAVAMGIVGASLILVSVGILAFAFTLKTLQKVFPGEGGLMKAGKTSAEILLGLAAGFAGIGLLSIPIILGSVAVGLMGVSLALFSVSILLFAGASHFFMKAFGTDSKTMKENVGALFGSLSSAYASIGWKIIPITLGTAAIAMMGTSLLLFGSALLVTAKAVETMKDPKQFIETMFGKSGLIIAISTAFANIGKTVGGSVISSFLGTDDVSKGVRAVRGMGSVLSELAGGIASFSNLSEFPIKKVENGKLIDANVDVLKDVIPQITANVPSLLTILSRVFADIGDKFGGGNGWFSAKSPVQKGVNAVKGIGSVLSELAGGIIAFAQFDHFPIKRLDKGVLVDDEINLYKAIPGIQTALVGDGSGPSNTDPQKAGILFALASIFGTIGEKYGGSFLTDSKVKKGVDSVTGIGTVLSELADGIIKFGQMDKDIPILDKDGKPTGQTTRVDLNAVRTNIMKVLGAIPEIFTQLDTSKIDKSKIDQLGQVADILDRFAKYGTGLDKFADSLVKTGDAFGSFGKGFFNFSSNLDQFIKFETSITRLAKNQYDYKFDKFATSMKELKDNVNNFDVKKLAMTDSMMKSLAILSKAPDALGKTIGDSLNKAFIDLVAAIKDVTGDVESDNKIAATKVAKSEPEPLPPPPVIVKNTPVVNKQTIQPPQQNMTDVITAITLLGTKIDALNNKLIKGQNGGLLTSIT